MKEKKRRAEEQEYLSREALMFYLVLMSPKIANNEMSNFERVRGH